MYGRDFLLGIGKTTHLHIPNMYRFIDLYLTKKYTIHCMIKSQVHDKKLCDWNVLSKKSNVLCGVKSGSEALFSILQLQLCSFLSVVE